VDIEGKCKELHQEVTELHEKRNIAITNCLQAKAILTKNLMKEKAGDPENYKVRRQLNEEQANLRMLKQELSIEAIVHKRAIKAFYERCRDYYNMDMPTTD